MVAPRATPNAGAGVDALAAARAAIAAVVAAVDPGPAAGSMAWSAIALGTGADDPARRTAADRIVAALGRAPEPRDLGAVYEALLDADARAAGAHFTAPDVARRLVDRAAPRAWLGARPRRVWDPACGGGAFLLAAADALVDAGHDPAQVVDELLWGTDVDPGAGLVTTTSLRWWAERHGAVADASAHVQVADALLDLDGSADGGFDLVVGNPPFQGQLSGGSVRARVAADALTERWGEVVAAYTDTAALFLVAGARALASDGRMALVLPLSTLAARDAGPARRAVEEIAELTGLWVAGEPVFEANVEVCAPVLRRRAERPTDPPSKVERWQGRAFAPVGVPIRRVAPGAVVVSELAARAADAGSWAVHALVALDVPDPAVRTDGLLGDLVRTAAGFRDEYYGLVGHVVEAPDDLEAQPDDVGWPDHLAALVTSGSIDVGRVSWGAREVRFGGERFRRPVVDRRRLPPAGRAAAWAATTAVPKVVVATQTRVGEAAVDARGAYLPSTPVVVAFAPEDRLWEVAAVVCSPVGSVAALARAAGTGRTADALRHTTASIRTLPTPVDRAAWEEGARALQDGDRARFVDAMAAAYAVDPADAAPLAEWWSARAPWPSPRHPPETA